MKKSDPTGSGETIEYPETKPMGDFPFAGYWSIVGVSAFDNVQLDSATYQDRQNIQQAIMNLINGPGRVFLADKLHLLGETISLNGRIPLNGLTGGSGFALGTIPNDVNDNGHLYIGSKVVGKPMQELWGSIMVQADSYQEAQQIEPLIEKALTSLYEKQVELQQIVQNIPTQSELERQTNLVNGMSNELARFSQERENLSNEIQTIQNDIATLNNLVRESEDLTGVTNNLGILLNSKLNDLRNAPAETRATVHTQAMDLQAEYRNSKNRLHAVQTTMSRLQSISNGGAINGMAQLLQMRNLEVDTAGGNLSNASILLQNMSAAYENGVAKAEETRLEIDNLTTQVQELTAAYELAQGYSNSITNMSDNEIIKLFADHLDGAQLELEDMYFQALRTSSQELLATKDTLSVQVNAEDVTDYTNYLEALADVDDAFSPDETTLLRMIGDFGYSRAYVPGAARIYALVSMGPTDRRRAYRNLIEEILTLGKSMVSTGLFDESSPLFKLELALKRKDADLRELSQLIEFLTDKRPDIQY